LVEAARAARYSDLFGTGRPAATGEERPGGVASAGPQSGAECEFCPFCAAIRVVRATRPEVFDHLGAAARELVVAAGMIVEEAERIVGDAATRGSGDRSGVRRIG
jgi:hypothetical protein